MWTKADVAKIFGDREGPALILFTDETGQGYQDAYDLASKELKDEIFFYTSGSLDKDSQQEFLAQRMFGLEPSDLPTLRLAEVGLDDRQMMLVVKYTWKGDITTLNTDSVKTFITDYKGGKLTPFYRSEKIEGPNDSPITIITGDNWNEIVMDSSKDVLVMVYNPYNKDH